jgi:hypothetical protein
MPLDIAWFELDGFNLIVHKDGQLIAPNRCYNRVLFVHGDKASNRWNAFFGENAGVLDLKEWPLLACHTV